MRTAILTPSRHRPTQLQEMIRSVADNSVGDVDIYVGIDEDDDSGYPFEAQDSSGDKGDRCLFYIQGQGRGDITVLYYRQPRGMQLASWTNWLMEEALVEGHDTIGSLGDDHRVRTPAFDRLLAEAYAAKPTGLVYGADGLQDERLPTAPFWSADVLLALGWFFPPTQKHLYADDYWKLLADDLGLRTYLPDLLIEHLHPSTGKAEADEINVENDSFYDVDRESFEAFVRDDHPAVLAKLRDELDL